MAKAATTFKKIETRLKNVERQSKSKNKCREKRICGSRQVIGITANPA
jgi:hypothetical protein